MKTPPKVPSKPEASLLQTGRDRKQAALIGGICFFFISVIFGMIIFSDLLDPFIPPETVEIIKSTNEVGLERSEDPWTYLFILGALIFSMALVIYYSYLYITNEDTDEKPPAAIKYEQDMKQYQLKLEEYNEELKKESRFYVGDGSIGSEMKNTCKRCRKIWYLDADELQDLENRLGTAQGAMQMMGGVNLFSALFNPSLAAQGTTTMAANTGALKSLADELNEKSRCPECQSRSIERTLVGKGENTLHKKVIIKRKQSGPSKMRELEKLTEMKKEGLIDDDEFKQMKKEILGK